jgi:hypothetical protein
MSEEIKPKRKKASAVVETKQITKEDCVLEARNLFLKLQELYNNKPESRLYSNLVTVEELIRSLNIK